VREAGSGLETRKRAGGAGVWPLIMNRVRQSPHLPEAGFVWPCAGKCPPGIILYPL
jgi:hypothetical protein